MSGASAFLAVEAPGIHATVQDLGRPGNRQAGVPPGGAMDRFSLVAANRLVGNPDGAGALECAVAGPTLVALRPGLVSVTGADFAPTVNGRPAPAWTGIWLATGDRLAFAGRRSGARVYIAVGGGIIGDAWLGSMSTYQLVGRGGIQGRPLKAGDQVTAGPSPRPAIVGRRLPISLRPRYGDEAEVAVLAGPHAGRLGAAGLSALTAADWTVSQDADRMGYRLAGEPLHLTGAEMVSFGLTFGCIQVPSSGLPILLMADHQTAGGYPVIAGVVRADLPAAAQLMPGQRLRFRVVGQDEAVRMWDQGLAALAAIG